MPNGTLKLYNKLTNALLVSLDILGTFNIEENLNETPSNMKVKVITTNTYREEFQVNTIAFHEDTNSWWVIKSDESTYLHTGEYEHEIALVEYLEWYAYKHLTNCAFAPNTYTLEQMLQRLFYIANLDVEMVYPTFLNKDKNMPFLSFENFTVANAIKNIGRAINAIPKMYIDTTSGFQPKLTFINRNGLDTAIVTTLNTQFPIAYEKNTNSSDQFTTRSVSNITNAKSSNLVLLPRVGGFKNFSIQSPEYNSNTAKVYLPSKIDSVKELYVYPNVSLAYITFNGTDLVFNKVFSNYYFDRVEWYNKLQNSLQFNVNKIRLENGTDLTISSTIYNDLVDLLVGDFPLVDEMALVNSTDTINTSYDDLKSRWFKNKMVIKSKFDFNLEETATTQDRISYYESNTNQITMSVKFREGLAMPSSNDIESSNDINPFYQLYESSSSIVHNSLYLIVNRDTTGYFNNKSYTPNFLIQVNYYPIADIKVSIDNDNDAQDEKYFNQSGKVIDAVSVSKLITSHTNDSVEGTKIRNARYTSIGSLLPVGQLVSDSNQLYVISQRSIDGQVKNGNEYYNVIYTLSRNRIARSENIVADSAVISYKTPDDNLVFRTQLYKDYLELSLTDGNNDTPYLPMSKALVLDGTLAGTNFDFTTIAEWRYKPTTITTTVVRHVANGSIFDLHKAKLFNINYQDNNVLGYRIERNSNQTPIQTPILYSNSVGKSTGYEFFLLDTTNLNNAITYYNANYTPDPIIPFTDLTQVNDNFYFNSVNNTQNNYSLKIEIPNYDKDAYEIPVFEYMLQVNDDYSSLGNVIVGNDLFSTFTGTLRYHYLINNSTRITAENANKLYTDNAPSGVNNRRVAITRTSATRMDLDLYSTFSGTRNTSAITNVGIYATDGTTVKFLFAINDYTMGDNDDIAIFINNWKI
jgi:hypothetical protein